jgi:sulfate permease, SulP family
MSDRHAPVTMGTPLDVLFPPARSRNGMLGALASTESKTPPVDDRRPASHSVHQDVLAGLAVASVSLPMCLATGLLLFAPLGAAYYPVGVGASLYGFIIGGAVATFIGRSSFVVSSPGASTGLVPASLLAFVASSTAYAQQPLFAVAVTALCVLLAGIWQIVFGVAKIARIVKFTPHPVMAGFMNGLALLIVWSQVKWLLERPAALAFGLALAGFVLLFGRWNLRVPAVLAGLVVGVALFYLLASWAPSLDLGPVLGPVALAMPHSIPLMNFFQPGTRGAMSTVLGDIVLVSLALAILATLESLLCFRAAQALVAQATKPERDLLAQALGNCASGAVGGMPITASALQTAAAHRAGGRTRIVSLTAIAVIVVLVLAAPAAFAAIPVVVLSGLLVATGVRLLDRWSGRVLAEAVGAAPSLRRGRALSDLAVVAVVMILTAAVSVLAGVVSGCVLAALIFIVNMSRPVIRRQRTCEALFSKRVRPAVEARGLRESGARRQVLELQGVLFFGNADDLSHVVRGLFASCDSIVLDLRGISDIDATGANILQGIVAASRGSDNTLIFCNVPADYAALFQRDARVFPDLDSALEWMEERVLDAHAAGRGFGDALTLWQHPLLERLAAAEREALAPHLVQRRFVAGAPLCVEGQSADCMWLLTRGTVSVRVGRHAKGSVRVESCAPGTTVGEMALLQFGSRSASVIADEEVEAWELRREAFERLSQARPELAATLLRSIAFELARRLRERTEDLRDSQRVR